MFEKFEPAQQAIDNARGLYDSGATWKAVAEALGASPSTARKYAGIWGWPDRPPKSSATATVRTSAKPETESTGAAGLARRVESAVRKELVAIEKRLGSATTASAEKNARVLASLVKSLAELRKLERDDRQAAANKNEGEHDEGYRPPRDLARLRDELEASLARIRSPEDAPPDS